MHRKDHDWGGDYNDLRIRTKFYSHPKSMKTTVALHPTLCRTRREPDSSCTIELYISFLHSRYFIPRMPHILQSNQDREQLLTAARCKIQVLTTTETVGV